MILFGSIFLFIFSFFSLKILSAIFSYIKIPIFGYKAHPLGLFFLIQIFVFSLPGVFFKSFIDVSSFRYDGINNSTILFIGVIYLYSIFSIMILVPFFLKIFKCNSYSLYFGNIDNKFNYELISKVYILIGLLCMLFHIYMIKDVPLIKALSGDIRGAYLARVDMQNNPDDYKIPYVSNLLSIFMLYQFLFTYYLWRIGNKTRLIYLLLSFIIAFYSITYDIQKYKFIILLISLVFMDTAISGKYRSLLFKSLFIIFALFQLYIWTMPESDNLEFIIMDRIIFAQNQGFYHMINALTPSDKYWSDGFYFVKRLGLIVEKPDVDVVPYIYGYNAPVVNVNSFFLGQAWAMFGYIGLIFSPIIVSLSISLMVKILDFLVSKLSVFTIPFMFMIIPTMKLNQSFSYFLYGKEYLTNMILFLFVLFLTCIFSRFKYKR